MKPAVITDIILVVFLLRFQAEQDVLQIVLLALLWAVMTVFFPCARPRRRANTNGCRCPSSGRPTLSLRS